MGGLAPAVDAASVALPRASRPGDSDQRVAARAGGFLFAGKLYTYAMRLVGAVIVARLLGADGNGLFNLAMASVTLVAGFGALGLDSAVVRYVSIFTERRDRAGILGALQVGVGLPGLVSIALGFAAFVAADSIASGLSEPRVAPLLRVASVLVPALVLNTQLVAALQGRRRLGDAVVALQFVQPTLRIALLAAAVLAGLTVWGAIVVSAVATVVGTGILVVAVARRFDGPWRGGRRDTGAMVRFALPVYFSNIVTTLGSNLQILMLGAFGSAAAVGIFAVADQVNLVATLFHTSIVAAAMPLFARLEDRGDTSGLEGLYRTTSRWTFALNLPIFLIMVLIPVDLLSIFGREFEAGALALILLACAALANAATGTSGAVLDMTGHTNLKFLNSSLSVGSALLLGVLLIPPLGLVGAAIAVLAATVAVNVARVVQVAYFVHAWPYDRSFGKPLVAGFAALVAAVPIIVWGAPLPALVRAGLTAAVVGVVYVAVLVRLGVTGLDRALLATVKARLLRRGASGTDPTGE